MKKLTSLLIAAVALASNYAGTALADDSEHRDDSGGGCGSGGAGSPTCLWSQSFESASLPSGWTVNDSNVVTSTSAAHTGSRSLKIYDRDPSPANAVDASVTFAGSLIGNFSDVMLSFYWKPFQSESPDQLQVQLLSGSTVLATQNGVKWDDDASGWTKSTLDFGAQNLNPFGLTLNLAINSRSSNEGFYVDDFCLTGTLNPVTAPIPEPETYAMMLAGLGLMGLVARRRKQKLTA